MQTLEDLQQKGVPRDQLSVISSIPFPHGVFPVREPKVHLPKISVAGGLLGIASGVALVAITSLAYPIKTGHMSIVPGLTTSVLAFEVMMLGIAISTLSGMVIGGGLTKLKMRIYDPLLTQGHVGVLMLCELPEHVEIAKSTFEEQGAEKILVKDGNDL